MKIVVMIFLLLPLSITRTYAASVCGYVFKELDKYSQQAFKANDPKYDRLDPKTWEPDISPLDLDGKGKGVISSFPRATPEIKTAATNRGLMQWWNALVLVKDRAEADQLIRDNVFYMKTDPLFTQLVLETGLDAQQRQELLPKAGDSKKVLAQKEQKLVEIWDRIYTNPEGLVGQSALQYRDSNGQWKYISLEEAKRFQFTESQYTNREINGVLQYFNQVMWVRTPWRGVVIHEHVLANRKLHPLNVDKELNALVSLSGLNKKSLELFYKQSLKDELDKGKADGLLKELVAYSILYKEGDRFLDLFKSYVKEVGEKERLENPLMSYLRNKLGHIDSDALTANQSFLRVLDMVREKILPA
ncbi:MAG: hypothetical protein KDD50_07425, partial [Bdellovibrionales bacterium]|nr:hypothetical protein [Bdellovibrionales bacterium]